MAPKKNDENEKANKIPKKRVVKPKPEKPKLKTPTVIKVKIPLNPLGPHEITTKLTKKQLTVQKKLELANEVAFAQLNKETLISEETPPQVIQEPKVPNTGNGKRKVATEAKDGPTQRKRRKKAIESVIDIVPESSSEDVFLQKMPRGKPGRKPAAKKAVTDIVIKEEKIETPNVVVIKPRRRPKLSRNKKEPELSLSEITDTQVVVATPKEVTADKTIAKPVTNNIKGDAKLRTTGTKEVAADKTIAKPVTNNIKGDAKLRTTGTKEVTADKTIAKPVTNNIKGDAKLRTTGTKEVVADKTIAKPVMNNIKGDAKLRTTGTKEVAADKTIAKPVTNNIKGDSKLGTTDTKIVKPALGVLKNHLSNSVATRLRKKNVPVKNPESTNAEVEERKAGVVEKRKTSINSNGSGLSWTQDVSTSSTTTCVTVTSNDFVRFDKKLPFVQITNIRPEAEKSSASSSSASSTSSSSASEMECGRRSLDLSASSSSAASPPRVTPPPRFSPLPCVAPRNKPEYSNLEAGVFDMDEMIASYDQIVAACEDFDAYVAETTARAGEVGLRARAHTSPAVFDALGLGETLELCRKLKRLLLDEDTERVEFARPAPPRARVRPSEEPRTALDERACEVAPSDRLRYSSFDQTADDDDALSLFAESITAIDSSRLARHEEYVPTPIAPPLESRRYRPTRIDARSRHVPFCEKQSADSTSVREACAADAPAQAPQASRPEEVREAGQRPDVSLARVAKRELREDSRALWPPPPSAASVQLSLLSAPPVPPRASVAFRNLCFFNLSRNCKYKVCRFAHVIPDGDELLRRVSGLRDEEFLSEYALLLTNPALRQRLGLLCAQECARRGLTRALYEGAVRLQTGDKALAQSVLELVLQHLNQADPPQDILEVRVGAGTMRDALLRALADTQNFSRFRGAFVRLAAHSAHAPPAVLAGLLERLCILPCDEALSRAMLRLVAGADPTIYQDRNMGPFEVQLSNIGNGVYEEFLRGKARATLRAAASPAATPPERAEERYTSPDTTQFDKRNYLPIEPMITRTVDFTRALTNTTLVTFNPSVPPPSQQTQHQPQYQAQKPFREWRKSPFPRNPNGAVRNPNSGIPPLMGPNNTMLNRLIVKRRQNNYPRRSGGNFYD